MVLGQLPPKKTATAVFGDFLAYMLKCTVTYIVETHVDGESLWDSVKGHAIYVLTHPNGWEGSQQALMRAAAIHGGLISDESECSTRIRLVTEGEASLHGCLSSRFTNSNAKLVVSLNIFISFVSFPEVS